MPLIQIATPFNIDLEFEIAEFHKRLFAYLVDFAILILFAIGMRYALHGGLVYWYSERFDKTMCQDVIFIAFPMLLYSLLFELLMNGQTIGKKVFRIKVISTDGGEPTLGQYLIRWIMKYYEWPLVFLVIYSSTPLTGLISGILTTAFFGIAVVIIIAVSPKSQRLGDIVAGTVVVNTRSKLSVHDTIFMNIVQEDYKVMFPAVMNLSDRDINTIKNVIKQTQKSNNYDMCNRVAEKIQTILKISTNMYSLDFLEKVIADYNYLATRE